MLYQGVFSTPIPQYYVNEPAELSMTNFKFDVVDEFNANTFYSQYTSAGPLEELSF